MILDISTKIIMQSNINMTKKEKKSDLVLNICKELGATTYLSGKGGSVDYLNRESFERESVEIEFQKFVHPVYKQCNTLDFVSGVSILDCFFNIGFENAKELFWENVYKYSDVDILTE